MVKNKDQSLKKLLGKSNDLSEMKRDTKEKLKRLREKAETNINYRETTYIEQKDRDVSKLVVL